MISCLILEEKGKWRAWGVGILLLFMVLPSLPLLWQALESVGAGTWTVGGAFGSALQNSIVLGLTVVVVSLAVGFPLGVTSGLYAVPGKKVLLALVALPLLVPSFLWAIGWSALSARAGRQAAQLLSGYPGCILVFSTLGVPLVLLTAYTAALRLSASQIEAARLGGGESEVIRQALRYSLRPALLAAALAGVLTLSDPAPGLIFGLRTAASEILTSFSALYDFPLAGRQCVALATAVLGVAYPLAYAAAPRLASEMMARQLRMHTDIHHVAVACTLLLGFFVLLTCGIALPLLGISLPALERYADFDRATSDMLATLANTVIYSLGAGVVAAATGFFLAFLAGRSSRLRILALGISVVLFVLPPALASLGIVHLAAGAPSWIDPLLRSRFTVCWALGLRFFAVAVVLALYSWAAISQSWTWAGAIHGLPLLKYLRHVLLPLLAPALVLSFLLVALLAAAEVGTVLLLHPPGQASFPLLIFTVMANAPQSLVASLCLLYVVGAGLFLTLIAVILGRSQT